MDAEKTTLLNTFLILLIIVGSIIIYFIVSLIGHQRRNQALYKSKILAEVSTLERERARVAADLHDELGPVLASVKFKVDSLEVRAKDDEEVVESINSNIDDLISRMKEISNNLLPKTLLNRGLVAAMTESVQAFNRGGHIKIEFAAYETEPLGQEMAVNIYRILHEIIHNTIKHSGGNRLKIEIRKEGNRLVILTEDDGMGFDYDRKAKEASGLGLRSMLSRTEILNGDMFIESQPGKGTKFSFDIPLGNH